MTKSNPSSEALQSSSGEAELREQITDILKEHEDHSPIYTCRYQIVDQLLDLIHPRERQARKGVIEEQDELLNNLVPVQNNDKHNRSLLKLLNCQIKSLEAEDD